MIFSGENTGSKGSFKMPYSFGMPSYLAPKIFTTQKTEEYFITSLYSQHLLYRKIPVIGVDVCEDDSNKKPDSLVKLENGKIIEVQVTRFTLTDYLNRRKISENKVEKIIKEINKLEKIKFPVNITFHTHKDTNLLPNSQKIYRAVAKTIIDTISKKTVELKEPSKFINETVKDKKLIKYIPVITLQRLPAGSYSNFFGRDNVFIDLDFDNVLFTKSDIEKECLKIYNRKNNGQSNVLLIWADTFEVLYDAKPIGQTLENQFEKSSFDEVYFFKFFNRLDIFLKQEFEIFQLKGNESIYE